jgi:hypothetical protein
MMDEATLRSAHRKSSNHRAEILSSESCGCFYCRSVFSPTEISEWVDEGPDGIGSTALCPRCGIDSVIGSAAGFPLDESFLSQMREFWFERTSTLKP